ncbi:MAG TPA: sulfite exporter TauE/SafE family protein [Solirubrobacteraceae bacterium]
MHIDPVVVGFGLGVGILVGMTGVGGGTLMTPILILIIGVKPITAIGTDLAYSAVTRSVGGWRHWRQRTVDVPLSLWMAVGSVPAAVAGVVALKALQAGDKQSFDDTVLITLGAVLMLCGIAMLARLLLTQAVARERERVQLTPRDKFVAAFLGLCIGFVLGVTSAGSGALITVALILVFRMAPRQVVGTDMFHAAILLWAAALAHIVAGDVDYGLAGTILIGSVPGVWLGSAVIYRVPVGALRICLALLLIGSSMALLQKAGADIPTAVLAGFPIAVGVLCLTAYLRSRNRETSTELRSLDRPLAPSPRSPDRGPLAVDLQAVGRD